jgi:hypothetical protein
MVQLCFIKTNGQRRYKYLVIGRDMHSCLVKIHYYSDTFIWNWHQLTVLHFLIDKRINVYDKGDDLNLHYSSTCIWTIITIYLSVDTIFQNYLLMRKYMCPRWLHTWSICLSSFMIYHQILNKSSMTGVDSKAWTVYPSGAPDFTPPPNRCLDGVVFSIFSCLCNALWIIVCLYFLWCVFFCLRSDNPFGIFMLFLQT